MTAEPTTYDAVVVGSGFGGAVTAARLAQAGLSVCVVERGRRWGPGDFPRGTDLKQGWLWDTPGGLRGLFEVRWLDRMLSVQAAGWGGGSLVYANVFARPPAEVFDDGWPDGLDRTVLDPYYDLVGHMQEVAPVGPDPTTGRAPDRTVLLEEAVAASGRRHASVRPQLAVRFGDPDVEVVNRHGATQAGCRFVGECVVGCPHRAKTTLDLTYLHVAERAGAVARTDTEVVGLRPAHGGYAVEGVGPHGPVTLQAAAVFLGAGAVGTTELLLRQRAAGTLPHLSPTLGTRFSGNGDYLGLVRRRPGPERLDRGPTITSTSIMDCRVRGRRVWFQLQDGNYPAVLEPVLAAADPAPGLTRLAGRAAVRLRRLARRPAAPTTAMTLLLMGRDSADGRLVLDHHGEAAVRWDNRANASLYGAEGRVARAVARRIGGRILPLPTWSVLRRAVTVHNLGGAPIGRTPEEGVVDAAGEVFGHPGLYVVDGAAVPTATGVNPSATIAAVAEWRVERFLRRRLDDPGWQAPETPEVRPLDVPEDRAAAAMRARGEAVAGGGLRFAERMTGRVDLGGRPAGVVLDLSAHVVGLERFAADPRHQAVLTGTATVAGLASAAPVQGTLELFPAGERVAMRYDLGFTDDRGGSWRLTGTKTQRRPWTVWTDLTTLAVTLTGESTASGTVRLGLADVARLTLALRGEGDRRRTRVGAVAAFLVLFTRGAVAGSTGRR